jgi:hypothetical protein
MNREGPPLDDLLRRLAETPADFLEEPRVGSSGTVAVAAVASDLLRALGGSQLTEAQLKRFMDTEAKGYRNRLSIALIGCWLLYDAYFLKQKGLAGFALTFLTTRAGELAAVAQSDKFVSDPDRREELARLCLKDMGLRPAGESEAQAQDRLNTISSVERQRVILAARQAEERSRAIREEMTRKAKAEADAKVMRE